jgi:hypothetical protein
MSASNSLFRTGPGVLPPCLAKRKRLRPKRIGQRKRASKKNEQNFSPSIASLDMKSHHILSQGRKSRAGRTSAVEKNLLYHSAGGGTKCDGER